MATKNSNSLLKNNNQVMNILLPVPVDIQNRSDNMTMLGFLQSPIRLKINCSFKGNLVKVETQKKKALGNDA